jgi:carbon monoxide dehydrogenase subunit G
MEFVGEERIEAPRDAVWTALNDPDLLQKCIPGCQSLTWVSATELAARITVKIGILSFGFSVEIALTDIVPMKSYTIHAEGKGGVAGFAKGAAAVTLMEDGSQTILRYRSEAQVEGKIAKLGSRLVDASAQKLASRFFADLGKAVTAGTARDQE